MTSPTGKAREQSLEIPNDVTVGIDIGGTSIKSGRLSAEGHREAFDPVPTDLSKGPGPFLDRLAQLARELGSARTLGVGVPGVFEPGTTVLAENPNLGALVGLDLRREISQRLGLDPQQIFLENDANVAALGEATWGAGRGLGDLVMVTLGTGVGGGLILDGEIFRGSLGQGAEVGHLFIHDRDHCDVPCGCGRWGCLESFASATAAMRRAQSANLTSDLSELCRKARDQAGPERKLLEAIGMDLGRGLAQVLVLLDVPTIAIGGGFGSAIDVLMPGIRAGIAERDFAGRSPAILPAELGADAGWIGAASLTTSPARVQR